MAGTDQSLYERNVLYDNELGFRTGTIRPSNRVVKNDFVKNDTPVEVGAGPLRIWNYDGEGNYWSQRPTGLRGNSYSPTAKLDSSLRESGVGTLVSAPATTILDTVRETVAGSRQSEVLDTAPRSTPVRPDTIERLETTDDD
jgi:nitrous oxidase accessory protein NosD